jgi:hypothetical protein
MPTRFEPSAVAFLADMPPVHGAFAFENGFLQGMAVFGGSEREGVTAGNPALAARFGEDWRRTGHVVPNPPTLDCARYLAGCRAAEHREADPTSGFGLGMVDTPSWGSPIDVRDDGGTTFEGAKATLVAFTPRAEPAAHISLNYSIWTSHNDWGVAFYADVLIVYVRPEHRRHGYSIDLAVAAGWLTHGIVNAVLAAMPYGGSFQFNGMAEYVSRGGERVCRAVWAAAEAAQSHSDPERPDLDIEPAIIRAS